MYYLHLLSNRRNSRWFKNLRSHAVGPHRYQNVIDRRLSTAVKIADSLHGSSVLIEKLQLQQDTVLYHKGAYFIIHDGKRISVVEKFLQDISYNMSSIIDASSIDVVDYIPPFEPIQYPQGILPGNFSISKYMSPFVSYFKWSDPFQSIFSLSKDTTQDNDIVSFYHLLQSYCESFSKSPDADIDVISAVKKMESDIGWDPTTSSLINSYKLDHLRPKKVVKNDEKLSNTNNPAAAMTDLVQNTNRPLWDLVDIVIATSKDLDFLEDWKPFIEKFHIIIIQDGDPSKILKIPTWANFILYNTDDITAALGSNSWIISSGDVSIRSFGFLVSSKDIIYTIDDDCAPPPAIHGKLVDPILKHVANLLTPSTPYYFNTVYDPFQPGVDFVRGYPYSLRNGISTGISHGLWSGVYDYDAPTQLLKSEDRNHMHADLTQTIPHGVLYSMSAKNLAFNKKLVGVALMQGLMGKDQPLGGYGDLIAGWASKVISDHIGIGVKSGAPYVHRKESSNPFTSLAHEFSGLFWQEEIVQVFRNVKLSRESKTASLAYLELADKVSEELSHLHPYFQRLSEAMKIWVSLWEQRFGSTKGAYDCDNHVQIIWNTHEGCIPSFLPIASRGSITPTNSKSTCAVFTIVHNEKILLPVWVRYYLKHVPAEDIFIVDHNTLDGSTDPENLPEGVRVHKIYGDVSFAPINFLNRQVEKMIHLLLMAGYPCVLYSDVDEIVGADLEFYPGGLRDYFNHFMANDSVDVVRVSGYQLAHVSEGDNHVENPINLSAPILEQRNYWWHEILYDKPLLMKVPQRYEPGCHDSLVRNYSRRTEADPTLIMIHLHYVDKDICMSRMREKFEKMKRSVVKDSEKSQSMNIYRHFRSFEEAAAKEGDDWWFCAYALARGYDDEYALIQRQYKIPRIPAKFKPIHI